jgi:hypothetical protein
MRALLFAVVVASAAACSGAPASGGPDAGEVTGPVSLPSWRLEDIQPESPRSGQTYGLDTFSGRIIVVTLVEGF